MESSFSAFGIDLDLNLRQSFRDRDMIQRNKKARCETKEGKISRGRIKSQKFAAAKKNFFDELRTGMAYESGIALKAATKTVKDSPLQRNPKGTRTEDLRCKYHHPDYCNKRMHAVLLVMPNLCLRKNEMTFYWLYYVKQYKRNSRK